MQKFWEVFHNAICHPLMAITNDSKWSVDLHDWSARKAWGIE